ncbi:MAG: type II secretion system protein [Candidatus Omnitrophota bacterium]
MRSLKKGFTILELLVVVLIIGVLAALAFPNFGKAKESTLDKEAQINLRLISAAEKIYHMENNIYFTSADRIAINDNLKLSLPAQNWNYKIVTGSGFTAKAQRANDATNVWCIDQAADDPYKTGCNW